MATRTKRRSKVLEHATTYNEEERKKNEIMDVFYALAAKLHMNENQEYADHVENLKAKHARERAETAYSSPQKKRK